MKHDAVKAFFLSCHKAKAITTLLPVLPEGVVARDVRIIDTIRRLQKDRGQVHISDVSLSMGVTRPSITSAITRLESLGYVEKSHDESDGRAVCVSLTQAGRDFAKVYIDCFYDWACDQLVDVSEQDLKTAEQVIEAVHAAMVRNEFDPADLPLRCNVKAEGVDDKGCKESK